MSLPRVIHEARSTTDGSVRANQTDPFADYQAAIFEIRIRDAEKAMEELAQCARSCSASISDSVDRVSKINASLDREGSRMEQWLTGPHSPFDGGIQNPCNVAHRLSKP